MSDDDDDDIDDLQHLALYNVIVAGAYAALYLNMVPTVVCCRNVVYWIIKEVTAE
jgi:hypothetical protein